MIINYEVIGDGKPVIILHGLGCDFKMMKACLEPIFSKKTNYKRIYIDLPGMGKSTRQLEYASSDIILDILLSFIDTVVKENFLLIGESYGGYLARGILSKRSKCIDGLMLLCPVVKPEKNERTLPNDKTQFKDSSFLEKLNEIDRKNFCEYAVLANDYTYKRYSTEICPAFKLSDDNFIGKLEKNYSFSFDVDKIISDLMFDKPCLFICGKQDTCVGYEDLWKLLKDYRRATFSILDVAGHNLQIEQTSVFDELVKNWLLRIEKFSNL